MVPNAVRVGTAALFAVIAVVMFAIYSANADQLATDIADEADANETLSESAVQQEVVASWAIRDAELEQIRQNGTRNGLLGICAAMLVSIAVNTALRERRVEAQAVSGATPPPTS